MNNSIYKFTPLVILQDLPHIRNPRCSEVSQSICVMSVYRNLDMKMKLQWCGTRSKQSHIFPRNQNTIIVIVLQETSFSLENNDLETAPCDEYNTFPLTSQFLLTVIWSSSWPDRRTGYFNWKPTKRDSVWPSSLSKQLILIALKDISASCALVCC